MAVSAEGRALALFRGLRQQVAQLDERIAHVTAHRDRLIQARDRKHAQIPLSDREQRMWQHRIDIQEGAIAALEQEKRALLT